MRVTTTSKIADMRSALAKIRYECARQAANEASFRYRGDLPRAKISAGDATLGISPRYAYSEAEVEATLGQFRRRSPGWARDAMERAYRAALAEFRAAVAAEAWEYEASGYGPAERSAALADLGRMAIQSQIRHFENPPLDGF